MRPLSPAAACLDPPMCQPARAMTSMTKHPAFDDPFADALFAASVVYQD
jgi:hypothetical protein